MTQALALSTRLVTIPSTLFYSACLPGKTTTDAADPDEVLLAGVVAPVAANPLDVLDGGFVVGQLLVEGSRGA